MLFCSGCRSNYPKTDFVNKAGKQLATCNKCRIRKKNSNSDNSKKEEQTKNWKENNKEYISYMNKIYRQTKDLEKEERNILIEKLKKEYGFENKVVGNESNHRKEHTTVDNIIGKECSVENCGWHPLIEYNNSSTSWDKLRTTCKKCLSDKRLNSRDKINTYYKTRRLSDDEFKIFESTRLNIIHLAKSFNSNNYITPTKYLGCSALEFKNYIELKFTSEMSWNKYGTYYNEDGIKQIGFHLDHIIPCAAFDLTNEDEIYLCFNYKNYQPLLGEDNMKKWCYYDENDKTTYIESVKQEIFGDKEIEIKSKKKQILEEDNDEIIQEIKEKKADDLLNQYNKSQELKEQEIKQFIEVKPKKTLTEDQIKLKEAKDIERKEEIKKQIVDITNDESIASDIKKKMIGNLNKSLSKIGSTITEEALINVYKTRKYGAANPISKKVCKLSLDGNLIKVYDSITEAVKDNKLTHNASISNCCRGIKITSGGFKWCYQENYNET
jgi:hypothetical protein